MKKLFKVVFVAALFVAILGIQNVNAQMFGMNITIPDRVFTTPGWYGSQEDNEVEPGCVTGHMWDLEAFFLQGWQLTMVGTYDFRNGATYGGRTYIGGDIFVDVTGDVKYGPPNDGTGYNNTVVLNKSGYDYVFHFTNWATMSYDLYSINAASNVQAIAYNINQESNPWIYHSLGTLVTSGTASYQTGLTDAQVGLLGGTSHNAVTVNLSPLASYFTPGNIITFHNTYQCGNDNLMGAIPEPGTVLLMGSGLIGFGVIARIRRKRS
ncbi:PEP-CTERM sorting domain-containing protein [candidate division KSB1 bacterium]|nr:PEP-CTERM sorting domain-containing protein [candidate division KSB1 bacterium]